tara:strand:+ start:817 stop:1239 length:423 start_codon:yes stop_codon:yes gene_type:complete
VNKDKIFELFDSNDATMEKGKDLINFNTTPYYKLGMFTKLIVNHFVFHHKLLKFLQKEQPSYNSESTKEASSYVVFNRAWSYIKQINIQDKNHILAILEFDPKILDKTLKSAIQYFEECEEYKKCAHIFSIQQILKERKK